MPPNFLMSSRREIIKQSTLATGGLLFASSSFGNFFIGKKPFVIIVGAGLAGLPAAYNLHKKKIDFVTGSPQPHQWPGIFAFN